MNSKLKGLLFLAITHFALGYGSANAQNRVVVVPLFDSSPTGVSAILIHCDRAGLVPEETPQKEITCRRSDTRASFTAVPAGHFLLVTDLILTNNGAGFGGSASMLVGLFDGDDFPDRPRFDFRTADLGGFNHMTFSTPYLILREGESIGAANTDNTGTATTANLFISGYLVEAEGFGG